MDEREISLKFTNKVTGESKLERYAQQLNIIKSALSGFDKGIIQAVEKSQPVVKEISKDTERMSKNVNVAFDYSAVRTFSRMLKGVTTTMSSLVTQSSSFLEDFNLFQVAFNGNYQSAERFINKMSEMYGLDERWLTRTTGIFKQLANAMDLSVESGEKLSKLMTEMSIDISSLYNVDVDRASSVLQSALAGQTKPIRSLTGGDITQATLQTTLDNLGIDRAISELSFAEKRLLIIISLTQQLQESAGDWGRTLESPANQTRILNEQWSRLTRAVGNLFLPIVAKVLPYLNAILMVLTEIIKAIGSLFGFKMDDYDYFGSMTGSAWDFDDAVSSAGNSVDKLKDKMKGLRGFDKLNVINTPNSSGASNGAVGVGGIDPSIMGAFDKAFDDYQKKLKDVQMKATKIRDKIMEWLGFTKKINPETGEVYFKFKKITAGTVLGALAVGGVIYKGINFIFKTLHRLGLLKFTNIKELFNLLKGGKIVTGVKGLTSAFKGLASVLGVSTPVLAAIVAAIVAVGAAFIYAYKHNDKFKEKVDNAVKSVKELIDTLWNKFKELAEKLKPLMDLIYSIISFSLEQSFTTVKNILGALYDGFVASFSAIADVVGGTAKIITDIINLDFEQAFKDLKEMGKNLRKDWNEYWDKIKQRFIDWKNEIIDNTKQWINDMKLKIKELPDKVDELPEKFGLAIGNAIRVIKEKIEKTNWKEIGEFIINKILVGMILLPFKAKQWVDDMKSKLWDRIINTNWFELGGRIIDAVIQGMSNFRSKLKEWAKSFVKGIKEGLGIHSPAKLILDAKIGDFSMDAITLGMERSLPKLEKEANNIVDTLHKGITEESMKVNFDYAQPNLILGNYDYNKSDNLLNNSGFSSSTTVSPTIIVQVGDKEVARQVLNNLQDMAKTNGKPITIGY